MTILVRSKRPWPRHLIALGLSLAMGTADAQPRSRPIEQLGDSDGTTAELVSNDASRRRDALDLLLAQPITVDDALVQKLLADPDPEVELRAMLLVGKRQLTAHLPRLLERLTDTNPKVRTAAAQAIAGFSSEQLGKNREVGPALERATADAEGDVRLAALEALFKLPRERLLQALDAVARAVEDERVAIRLVAAEGAGQLRHRQLLIPLLGRLNDPAREVRAAALEALGQINDPRVASALIRQASEGPEEVRSQAMLALGRLGAPTAVPFLRQQLTDGPDKLRGRAAQALGLAGRTQASLALGIARDLIGLWSRDELRPTLAEALLTLGPSGAPALAELLQRPALLDVETVVRLLGQLPQAGNVGPLLDELQRKRARPELVVAALGEHMALGDRRIPPVLLGLLGGDDRITRRAAMDALAGRLDARAASVLQGLIAPGNKSDEELQRFAARELGRLAQPAARADLERLLTSGSPGVTAEAARALGRIADDKIAAKLEPLLGHTSARVRFAAAESLAEIASPQLVTPLCRRLKPPQSGTDDELLPATLLALEGTVRGRPDGVARELLLGIAERREPVLSDRALAVIGAMRDPEAARRLQLLVQKKAMMDSTRAAAARALFSVPSATRALVEMMNGDLPATVRAEAAWALRGTKDDVALAALKTASDRAPDLAVRGNAKAALAYRSIGSKHFVHVKVEDVDKTLRTDVRYRIDYAGGITRYGRTDATGTVHDEAVPEGKFNLVLLD